MTTRDYQKKNGFAIFLSYFKPHRKLFILDMICATLVSFVNLIYPILSRRALHDLLPQKAYAAFFGADRHYGRHLRAARAALLCHHLLGPYVRHPRGGRYPRASFTHIEELSFDFYDNNRTGHLMSRLTTDLFEITELAHHGPEDLFIRS